MQKYLQAICDAARCAPPETEDDHLLFFFTLTFFFGSQWGRTGGAHASNPRRRAMRSPRDSRGPFTFFFLVHSGAKLEGHICDAARRSPRGCCLQNPQVLLGLICLYIIGLFLIHEGSFAPILSSRSPRGCQDPLVNECW